MRGDGRAGVRRAERDGLRRAGGLRRVRCVGLVVAMFRLTQPLTETTVSPINGQRDIHRGNISSVPSKDVTTFTDDGDGDENVAEDNRDVVCL